MSKELDSMLISNFNGLDTGLKPNLGLKASKYESVTPGTFLATVEITLFKEVFKRCYSRTNKNNIPMKPSKTCKNKTCLCPYQQEKINLTHTSCQLKIMDDLPPPIGFWLGTPTKSGCLV